MSNGERIAIALALLMLAFVCAALFGWIERNQKGIGACEIRLQHMEHLLSLSLSELRSPAIVGSTNQLSLP